MAPPEENRRYGRTGRTPTSIAVDYDRSRADRGALTDGPRPGQSASAPQSVDLPGPAAEPQVVSPGTPAGVPPGVAPGVPPAPAGGTDRPARRIPGGVLRLLAGWPGWLTAAATLLVLGWSPLLMASGIPDGAHTAVVATAAATAVVGLGAITMRQITLLQRTAARSERARADAAAARAAAEEEARSSHNHLQDLIDNTSAVIYMKRVDNGRYLLVNREWERLFGVPRDIVINLTDREVFPRELAAELRANDLGVARVGRTMRYEETAEAAGELRTFLSVKFPVLDGARRIFAVCGISTDITELKHAEEEARLLNTELEARVRERTAELEASTRELDAFAYSVSHDLRAPLRSLYGFSEVFLEDYGTVVDATGRDYLRRLQRNVERMGQMIDDLLNLSRATRVELTRVPVDLTAMAREILAELAAAEPDRRVEATVEEGLEAYGDAHLVRLALHNMLANAWKFTAKRDVARLRLGRTVRAGEQLFFVRDNGAGFDMRYADKLFHAFQRLHPAADFEGSGIGLAIVHRVVRRHGGRLFAESAVGEGTTFYFNLTAGGAVADRADR